MHLALTILAIIAVIGVPAFIGYKVGRAVERSRIRADTPPLGTPPIATR